MRPMVRAFVLTLCTALFVLPAVVAAQESPFISPELYSTLAGEISGDISYDHLRHLTLHHSPNGASRGFRAKMRWIAEKAGEFGLEEVRIIDDLKFNGVGWSPLAAELFILSPEQRRLTSYAETAVAIADYSRSGTWEGELVDVGGGISDADYEGKDVAGKIVLTSGSPSQVMDHAVWKRGALGIVYYNESRGISYPDQVAWTRLNARPPEGKQNTFAFSISYRAGMDLKRRLAPRPKRGATPGSFGEGMEPGETIRVRAVVESEFEENPRQWIVEGWIRGSAANASQQAIVLTAHGQEEKTSANDDNSGCANLLEIARALTKLIKEGRLPRPQRDIRFWWVNEFSSEYEFFSVYPDERGKMLVNLNQDMVGAKQSAGSRIQHISRLPHSQPTYLEDVVESIALAVMRGNSPYLSAGQAGTTQPYSRPVLSQLGTRERYGAELVPYFDSTDHHVFNEGIIGIPGMTLTNWPDDFIHSSDDDLWQMDPTQLQRNAFIITAAAWYFATLDEKALPSLVSRVHSNNQRRLAEAYARATELLGPAPRAQLDETYKDSVNLIRQAARRAKASLESLRVFSPGTALAAAIADLQKALTAGERGMYDSIQQHYRLHAGRLPQHPDAPQPELEKTMQRKVPAVAVGVKEWLDKRGDVPAQGLHSLMKFEVLNFVDGKRSYWSIYEAVRAEMLLAGEWYYGKVEPQQVSDLLDAAVKAGILRLARE